MKTIFLTLFISINLFANNPEKRNPEKGISGLDIYTYSTKTLGIHIYVVSAHYTEKKVEFIDNKGKVVLSKNTVGTPITLNDLDPGIYKVKITENNKTDILEYEVE